MKSLEMFLFDYGGEGGMSDENKKKENDNMFF